MKKLLLISMLAVSSCGKPTKVENFGATIKPSPIDSLVISGYPAISDSVKVDSVK